MAWNGLTIHDDWWLHHFNNANDVFFRNQKMIFPWREQKCKMTPPMNFNYQGSSWVRKAEFVSAILEPQELVSFIHNFLSENYMWFSKCVIYAWTKETTWAHFHFKIFLMNFGACTEETTLAHFYFEILLRNFDALVTCIQKPAKYLLWLHCTKNKVFY